MNLKVSIRVLPHGRGLPLPHFSSAGSAGMDLYAAVGDSLLLQPHCSAAIPTGIAIALPDGFEGQIRPRSGLALDHNIGIINSPGTIDSDYRGEILVILTNFSDSKYEIRRGDRIAQLIVARYEKVEWDVTDQLPATQRGADGFGHSGK